MTILDAVADSPWLDALVAPIDAHEFLSAYWRTRPVLCRGPRDRFSPLLSWRELNEILERHWRETYRYRLARRGRDLDPALYADLDGMTPRIRAGDLTEHLRRGATLSFDAVDEVHPPLRRLAETFEAFFHSSTKINVYLGFGALHGLDLHRDDQEIFVLQLDGRKRWVLYGAAIDHVDRDALASTSTPPDGAELDEILQPGDLLYVPRGCYHVAVPMNEPVLHVTVSIRNPVKLRPSFDLPWSVTRGAPRSTRDGDLATGDAPLDPPRDEAVAAIARGLRDPRVLPSADLDALALVDAASRHRVLVLLGTLLRDAGTLHRWPTPFAQSFAAAERDAAIVDCIRQVELTQLVDALGAANIPTLLLKGAALAHTHYPAPHVRGRTDTDLLVSATDVPAVQETLTRLGYARQQESFGELVSYQSHWGKTDRHGVFHAVDLHWKISNRQALADRLTFDELWAARLPIPALGASAATAPPVHALLVAMVHRAHHPGSRDLLWIYDLHALASALAAREQQELVDLATARGLRRLVCDGLTLARDTLGTPAADRLISALSDLGDRVDEASPLPAAPSQAELLRHDLRALPTWRARARLVREHLFPAPQYMRDKYGVDSTLALPALYAWRIAAGASRWLRRPCPPA